MWNGKKVFEEIMADNFPYLAKKKKNTHKFKDSRSSANSKQKKKEKQNLKEIYAQMHQNQTA